ncbi:MAG: OadG family protein [Thermoanaerobaculia bacterium]
MENLSFGLSTTVVGMGLVFGLLALLWGMLSLLGRLDSTPPADEAASEEVAPPATSALPAAAPGLEPDALAAVTIALLTHTLARRRQAAPEMRSTQPGSQIYASRWLAAGRTRQTRSWQPRRN